MLAEGLLRKDSRGDKTAIELFIAGVRGWPCPLVFAAKELTSDLQRKR